MRGRLIVIDGLDGSGKSTQAPAIFDELKKKNEKTLLISYPDYESESSALVRLYLEGKLSNEAEGVNAYAASSFYAVDRYASFKQHWESYYNDGYTIIATRYVSSNAIHQMVKLDESEWDGFLDWLDDYEYGKLGLPYPDMVIFLDMTRDVADSLISSRYGGDDRKRDIHEKNQAYLRACERTAYYAANKQGWEMISCSDGKKPYSVEEIKKAILERIEK